MSKNQEINVSVDKTREFANKIKCENTDKPYDKSTCEDHIYNDLGDATNSCSELSIKIDRMCAITCQLMELTQRYLMDVADKFEEQDASYAEEVSHV